MQAAIQMSTTTAIIPAPAANCEGSSVFAAALVDEQGREIPITEDMIRQACSDLMLQWKFPVKPLAA